MKALTLVLLVAAVALGPGLAWAAPGDRLAGTATLLLWNHTLSTNTFTWDVPDAHGSRGHPHLINFMLRDRTGRTVVSPSKDLGRLEYLTPKPGGGPGSGQCYLQCHGKSHKPESYP